MAATNQEGEITWSATYDPFGDIYIASGSSIVVNLRYPGQYESSTGRSIVTGKRLYYNWHRWYDPGSGRYLTADPISASVVASVFLGAGFPLAAYGYANGSPLMFSDPTGLYPCPGCNECSDENRQAILQRLREVKLTIDFLIKNKSCGNGSSGGGYYCKTTYAGGTECSDLYYSANVCVRCCVDAHEATHQDDNIVEAFGRATFACWVAEGAGYRAEERCLNELLAGKNQ